jgi:hypothetical protein
MDIKEESQMPILINVTEDFSETPGGRYEKTENCFSGERFREDVLIPKYEEATSKQVKLIVNLDGGYGYVASFLEEAFGGLVRSGYDKSDVLERLEFISREESSIKNDIVRYIEKAIPGRSNVRRGLY